MNEKALIKSIKESIKKDRLVWQVKNHEHFISNTHWAVRFLSLSKDVSTTLFSIFGKFPENDTTLVYHSKTVSESSTDIARIMQPIEYLDGRFLPLSFNDSDRTLELRLSINDNGDIYAIQSKYADIFEGEPMQITNGMTRFESGVCMQVRAKTGNTWNGVIREHLMF